MARPDPERLAESQQSIPSWEKFLAETEPLVRLLTEHGYTKGEAQILLSLNRIESMLENLLEQNDA